MRKICIFVYKVIDLFNSLINGFYSLLNETLKMMISKETPHYFKNLVKPMVTMQRLEETNAWKT